jgi:hypothetical protein
VALLCHITPFRSGNNDVDEALGSIAVWIGRGGVLSAVAGCQALLDR